jgi:3',5'-cyclic AMP phosphodiesterase CpdA
VQLRLLVACLLLSATASAQAPETVRAILPPKTPLPPEAASAGVTKFSFIAYGDTRGRREGKDEQYEHNLVVETMLPLIKRLETTPFPVRFVLMTGDAVMSGKDPRQWNVSFAGVVNRLTQGAGLPYYMSPGNHDVGYVIPGNADKIAEPPAVVRDRGAGVRNYLAAMADLVPRDGSVRRLDGYPTYAFGYGSVFVLALDSNIAGDDRQLAWARAQLEGLDRRRYHHVVAFFHHPVFSSGPHGGGPRPETATANLRARFMPLFRKHHVALLLSGHEHLFEHWVERYDDGGHRYRMDEIVTGGGGAPIYTFQGRPELRDYLQAGKPEKVSVTQLVRPGPDAGDNPYHFVLVQVDGDRLRLEVIGVDWGSAFAPYRSRAASLTDEGEGTR